MSSRSRREDAAVAEKVLREIRRRLGFLTDVGLDYLTLDRLSSTLSGGESQRINLATSLGSALVDTLYVLDEPSIGLHPRDNQRLIAILLQLRDQGNTVLVVEHDADMIRVADEVVDLGLGAGEQGGRIIYAGSVQGLINDSRSLTAKYLRDDLAIPVPAARRRPGIQRLRITGASEHNLKDVDVEIPLGLFTCVTGVSGSGKSTLVHDVIYAAIKRAKGDWDRRVGAHRRIEGAEFISDAILVDQQPIGRTPRSNPVTYLKAFDPIRELFAATKDARTRGLTSSHFSFNVPGGRCEACEGEGVVRVEMQFLADVFVPCEQCDGKRFRPQVLEVRFKGRNIDQVLDLTVREALTFFAGAAKVVRRLQVLDEIGLGYLRLGQPATTLSGGEAQRIKIASHLGSQGGERMLYVLDEPTTGLHFDDIVKLLAAFRKLLHAGHSLLVIEHNLDVLKTADWIIDLGPEGGDAGGAVVAVGTPEQIARVEASYTGQHLRRVLSDRPRARECRAEPEPLDFARGRPLPAAFYARPTLDVAADLIGKVLVHTVRGRRAAGMIVEAEAYIGESDPACHAAPGPTARNAPLYGPPGTRLRLPQLRHSLPRQRGHGSRRVACGGTDSRAGAARGDRSDAPPPAAAADDGRRCAGAPAT